MDYLTTQQVGEILGVSRPRIIALIQAGRLPAQKVGRDWLIRPDDLANFKLRPQGNYKLTLVEIEQIKQLSRQGVGVEDLARQFKVTQRTIYRHIKP